MFSLILIIFVLRAMNRYLHKDGNRLIEGKPSTQQNQIENYGPLLFHVIIIGLILISYFMPGILSAERVGLLIDDGIFQFVSTMLIVIIALINPFVSFSPETKLKLEEKAIEIDSNWIKWLLKNRNWQFLKLLLCLLIVGYFVYNGYLVIPKLNQGILSGITLVLIFFFLAGNIIQLIKNPRIFKRSVMLRLSMLYKSFVLSFFVSAGIILMAFLISIILNFKFEEIVNVQVIILLVYNAIMASNEYKVLNS